MITVLLKCSEKGCLLECNAKGHALYASHGKDIVCSAVSVLLRTVLQILSDSSDVTVEGNFSERGNLSFTVSQFSSGTEQLLIFAGNFLKTGLSSVVRDFPKNLELICKTA